ncbi:FAD:protein FMN transferase [Cognatishimia sp. F0-27]|uniref:FAD:protein FMN transferase n=1 Tax=Cognatishimia sp. F0-27 TaxID=2816855 RepID=UPI001D0C3240|nr:FAD:protein FMN transferase [Cognatishimia sp. F0-27]MCC1493710.1 FAD:protein FMN transferase [Cognatishimia sp. F0-27]
MHRHLASRRTVLAGLAAALITPSWAQAAPLEELTGRAFGTSWRITGAENNGLARLRPALDALFSEIDQEMSPWRADSTISRFNASPPGVSASAELIRVVQAALALAHDSGGAFDPTVGPLVARWGFGPITGGAASDWRGLILDAGRLSKRHTDLTLDLCGIAKGRALDRAVSVARGYGMDNLLLDLGGELHALGPHPTGRDWHVAVAHPWPGHPPHAILHLPAGMAVATSGLGVQSYTLNGRLWGHIMDPATARPVDGRLRSVTVLAGDAMTADGWATALFAAGDKAGPALARERDIAALFLFDAGASVRGVETGGIGDVLT